MHFRQDDGEIAPATWLGGSVTAVTLGGVVLLAERQIGTEPAFIVFWCGCALAAICLFGAGRQHFINVGRDRERGGVEHTPEPRMISARVKPPQQLSPSPVPSSPSLSPDERHFVSVTPSEIFNLVAPSLTSLQGRKLVQPYFGKWIEVAGTVSDVSEQSIVVSEHGGSARFPSLFLGFDDEWRDRFTILRRDEFVRVAGEIVDVSVSYISMKHCELLSSRAVTPA